MKYFLIKIIMKSFLYTKIYIYILIYIKLLYDKKFNIIFIQI